MGRPRELVSCVLHPLEGKGQRAGTGQVRRHCKGLIIQGSVRPASSRQRGEGAAGRRVSGVERCRTPEERVTGSAAAARALG